MATHACSTPALTRCLPQVMAKTVLVRRSRQGKLSKDKIKAAFAKNKRLPTPYEERLYQVRAALDYNYGMHLAADLPPVLGRQLGCIPKLCMQHAAPPATSCIAHVSFPASPLKSQRAADLNQVSVPLSALAA